MNIDDNPIEIKCLKVTQPIGEFYLGVMDHNDLINVSFNDIRTLEKGNEMREVEIFSGIQRRLSEKRVKEIGQYVNFIDATFPTGIILHIEPKNIRYDSAKNIMFIRNDNKVAKILDGQHRIAGLQQFKNSDRKFQLNVTIFVGMELEDQAIVFATINKTQTKVNKSLVVDLYDFAKSRSPYKTAHIIIRALNQESGSPFEDKIKILGTAIDKDKETITQATFADLLINYISKDPLGDRDTYKRNKIPERYVGNDLLRYPLRNLFIDKQDDIIAKLIWNYFDAVRNKWPSAWDEVVPEMILNKSTGFLALMRFFRNVYNSFDNPDQVINTAQFSEIFNRIRLKQEDFTRDNYLPGTGGQTKLYRDLKDQSQLPE